MGNVVHGATFGRGVGTAPELPGLPVLGRFSVFPELRESVIGRLVKVGWLRSGSRKTAVHLLFRVIYASACRSTHHKLALDAVRELAGPEAEAWQRFFLRYYEAYLEGAKAPDDKFKDFTNHVLHVSDGYWGGAIKTAQDWYGKTVQALDSGRWSEAAYNAGVLSHYFTDPIQPFHTGQSTAENNIHRAAEWSICKSYDELRQMFEATRSGRLVRMPRGEDWLGEMIRAGAVRAHAHYQTLITRYDLDLGVANPPLGLDRASRAILADLIGYAAEGFARVLERAVVDANVLAPQCWLAVPTVLAAAKVPARYVLKQIQDADERRLVEAMYDELLDTGRVEQMLPDDDRAVRDAHAREVLGRGSPVPERPVRPVSAPAVTASATAPHVVGASTGVIPAARPAAARSALTAPVGDWPGMTRARPVPARKTMVAVHGADPPTVSTAPAPRGVPLAAVGRSTIQSPAAEAPGVTPSTAKSPAETAAVEVATLPVATTAEPPWARVEASATHSSETGEATAAGKFYLEPARDVVDAPSIGPKMARRLNHFGIQTVADLLAVNPQELAGKLNLRYVTAEMVRDWQDQALLVCRIPNLRGHDAQILVACGYRQAEEVAEASVGRLYETAREFSGSVEGQRLLRGAAAPDRAEIEDWKSWAGRSRTVRAA